jgi:hypothetical protein
MMMMISGKKTMMILEENDDDDFRQEDDDDGPAGVLQRHHPRLPARPRSRLRGLCGGYRGGGSVWQGKHFCQLVHGVGSGVYVEVTEEEVQSGKVCISSCPSPRCM